MTFTTGFSRRIACAIIAVSLLFAVPRQAVSATIVVKPGQFDHFTLQMPERVIAGENAVIKVQAYDVSKNLITNFSETGKEFKVEVTGSSTVQPPVIGNAAFSGGVASIIVNSRKAEKITFSIRETGGSVPVISRELEVLPNKLDHFQLNAPKTVTAGVQFDVKVIARDRYENTVLDSDIGRNIKFTSTGTSSVKIAGGSTLDFRNGNANAVFVAEKTGDFVIEMQEIATGSSGKTASVSVTPASLSLFKLQAPRSAVAGEPFDLLITAYDAFDNVVTNYSSAGSGVLLTSSGGSKTDPGSVGASEFKNGQASVRVTYEKAEEIQITAKESNRQQAGKTAEITVANAAADHFVVVTPETAKSGQKFKLKVEAYDRFNNQVRNFNLIGSEVFLNTTGTGTMSPSRVSASEFVNGVAMVDVVYDKAESFQVSAALSTEKARGQVTVHEGTRKEVPVTPKKEKPAAEHKAPAEKKPAQKPKETKPQEKKAETAEEPKKAAQPKKAPATEQTAKAETKPAPEKPVEAKPTVKPEPKPAETKPVETAKKAAPEATQKAAPEKKSDKPLIYSISNVSVVESKNKAMLVINVTSPNGTLEFSDEIESRLGKEWLKLKVRPAVNNTGKSFKFQSTFVGDVLIEQDKSAQNTLYFLVELLPSGVTYDIARVKNSLIVTFANP